MIVNDRHEQERVDARNALEEFVYEMRDKLQEDSQLAVYVTNIDRQAICDDLNNLENWLYEDGEDCDRQQYRDKLSSLQERTNPIKNRFNEYDNHPQALTELGHAIQLARKAVDEFRKGEPKYDHLTETEMINIEEASDRAQKWLDESRTKLIQSSKTVDPPIKLTDIHHEYQTLTTCVNSVLKRPKPTPPPPPTTAAASSNGEAENGSNNSSNQSQPSPGAGKDGQNSSQENEMDVE